MTIRTMKHRFFTIHILLFTLLLGSCTIVKNYYILDGESITLESLKSARKAKFNVVPDIRLVDNDGLKANELKMAEMVIEENQEMCRVLLSPHGDMNFLHRLNKVVREKCLQMWPNEEDKKDATFEYHYSFVVYGCVGVFRAWLNSKCQEPAEKMAEMADAMIRRGSLS